MNRNFGLAINYSVIFHGALYFLVFFGSGTIFKIFFGISAEWLFSNGFGSLLWGIVNGFWICALGLWLVASVTKHGVQVSLKPLLQD